MLFRMMAYATIEPCLETSDDWTIKICAYPMTLDGILLHAIKGSLALECPSKSYAKHRTTQWRTYLVSASISGY
jgi:hypothetical protein